MTLYNPETKFIEIAKKVFTVEARAIEQLSHRLDGSFNQAIHEILRSSGKLIVCGMGKSGIIAKKIAATLSSTGTPSFFMHPAEAYHGDLGMVTANDTFIAISNSGETEEIIKLIPFLKDNGNYLISFTGAPNSTLALAANVNIDISVEEEACPLQLAPTSSTTATLAMGDALAVTLMQARNFLPENFARFHPGGSLGRRLLRKVEDEMYADDLPLVDGNSTILDVIGIMSRGRLGMTIVSNKGQTGIITDGDIRRAIEEYGKSVFDQKASDLMSHSPISAPIGTRINTAFELMEEKKITSLLIVNNDQIVGILKK